MGQQKLIDDDQRFVVIMTNSHESSHDEYSTLIRRSRPIEIRKAKCILQIHIRENERW